MQISTQIVRVTALTLLLALILGACSPSQPAAPVDVTATAGGTAMSAPATAALAAATAAATFPPAPSLPSPTAEPVSTATRPAGTPAPVAAACGFEDDTYEFPVSSPPASDGYYRAVIKWYIGLGTGTALEQVEKEQEIVEEFNNTNTVGIYIALNVIPNAEAYNVLATQIAAGTPPDIIGPVGVRGLSFAGENLLPLDDLIARHQIDLSLYDEGALKSYQNERGELIALPYAVFPSFIYYNRDLFDAAGLPYPPQRFGEPYEGKEWTMDALRELALKLTLDEQGKNAAEPGFDPTRIVQFGFVPQWNDSAISEGAFFGAGDLTGPNNEATIPDAWKESWKWFYRARHADHFVPDAAYSNSDEFGKGNVWSTGKVAMAWTHLWYTCCFTPEQVPNWDIAVVPSYNGSYTSKLHADTFAIMKQTQNPDAAFEVYKFLLYNSELRQLYGGLSAINSEHPAYFALLDEKFAPNEVNWQVVIDSLAYPDIPNHEQDVPNSLKFQDRYVAFDQLRHANPSLDIDAEIEKFEQDLQQIFGPLRTPTQGTPTPVETRTPSPVAPTLTSALGKVVSGQRSSRVALLLSTPESGMTLLRSLTLQPDVGGSFDSIAFSPDGSTIATEDAAAAVQLWSAADGAPLRALGGLSCEANGLAFSPDGTLLAAGSLDRRVRVWDVASGALALVLEGHERGVVDVAFSPDGRLLASASRDGSVRLWRVADGRLMDTLKEDEPGRIGFSSDGTKLLIISTVHGLPGQLMRVARMWNVDDGTPAIALIGGFTSDAVQSFAFRPRSREVALAGHLESPRGVSLWGMGDGTLRGRTTAQVDGDSVAFSPDGTLLAAGLSASRWDKAIAVWRADDRAPLGLAHSGSAPLLALSFAPDGSMLFAASRDGTVGVWQVAR